MFSPTGDCFCSLEFSTTLRSLRNARRELSRRLSSAAISCIEIGGILGTLWCGWVSDSFHLSRSLLCEVASVVAGLLVRYLPRVASKMGFLAVSFFLGFFLYIPFSFSELIAIESVDAKYASFIIAMNGLVSPFGSVFSGIPVNLLIQKWGWETVPKVLNVSFILFSVLLWVNHRFHHTEKEQKEL